MPTITEQQIQCINPTTGEKICNVKVSTEPEITGKVNKAKEAFPLWSSLPIEKRIAFLSRVYEIILSEREDIAKTISTNTGKPIAEAYLTEVASALQVMEYFIKNASSLLNEKVINLGTLYPTKKSSLSYEPLGIIAIIKPWNYPFYLSLSAITKALICGNTFVLKPSSVTSHVGNLIEEIFKKAELPENVANFIYGDRTAGNFLVKQNIDRVIFTGSVEAGKEIARLCSERLIPVSLELGGKDPAIVLKDTNLDYACSGVLWGSLSNCGQACASIERVYVQAEIFNDFIERLILLVKQLKVGNPFDDETDIGPLITEEQLIKVESQIEDAVSKGANVHLGGKRIDSKGFFLEPALLSNVNHSMKVMSEETFGPVIPVMKFETAEEAVKLANDSRYGLAASIWSGNLENAKKLAKQLICGTIWINDSLFLQAHPKCPWQGCKESSYGSSTLYDFVRVKHIDTDQGYIPTIRPKSFWWYPYKGKAQSFNDLIGVLFKQTIKEKAKAAFDTFIDFLK